MKQVDILRRQTEILIESDPMLVALKTELLLLDISLDNIKLENAYDRMLSAPVSRNPFPKSRRIKHNFLVITNRGNTYPLTAHTDNAKKYATALYNETGCTVRVVGA